MAAAEQFRNRRWRGRRQVQESESVACTRKCHGYAVGGVDGAEALRGCTLRRACASVSKWRASELCRPRPKKNFADQPVKNFRQKAVARNDSRDRRGRKRIGTRKTKNRRAEMDALRRRKTFVRRHSKAVCRVCCATGSALLARRGAPLGRREGAPDGIHDSRCEETPFALCATNRAQIADSRDGHRGACAARAPLHAPCSQRGAQRR